MKYVIVEIGNRCISEKERFAPLHKKPAAADERKGVYKMKKKISLILSFLLLLSLAVPAAAMENDEPFDIMVIVTPEVLRYDADVQPDGASHGDFSIEILIPSLEKYKSCRVNVDFNTDILAYSAMFNEPVAVYTQSCEATPTGVSLTVAWNDEYADRADGWNYSTLCSGEITGTGDANFSVTAEVQDVDGNPVDATIKFVHGCDTVMNRDELDFVELEDILYPTWPLYFDCGTTVGEVLSHVKTQSAQIMSIEGTVLTDSDLVANGARIVTKYREYIVDECLICVPYDVDCDGRITAADARQALRAAAKLAELIPICQYAANSDGAAGITAAEARLILRKSAKLA